MAIISSSCFAEQPIVTLDVTESGGQCIIIRCGDGSLFLYADEAAALRDNLSRAILESATQSAKAVEANEARE